MPYATASKTKIYYETWGSHGEWVTLLTGTSRTLSDFRGLARFLEPTYQLVAIDNRGAGKTEAIENFTLEEAAGDVVAVWRDLRLSSSHLLGMSYGGALALAVAKKTPSFLRSLLLVSTAPSSSWIPQKEIDVSFDRYFSPRFLEKSPLIAKALKVELSRAFREERGLRGIQFQREALREFDFTSTLPQLSIPILVLHGDADQIISVEAAKASAKAAKNSTLEVYPEIGHLMLVEAPKRFYASVKEFLDEKARN